MTTEVEHDGSDRRNYVASVIKACTVVEALAGGEAEYTLAEVAESSDLGKTTVHRLLASLQRVGWVERGPRNGYRLSLRMARLTHASLKQFSVRHEALPHLRTLAGEFGDTAFLLVPAGDDGALVVEMVEGNNPLKVNTVTIGATLPYHAGGGPAVMAALDDSLRERVLNGPRQAFTEFTDTSRAALEEKFSRIREQGYVFAKDDLNIGVAVVSGPVYGPDGAVTCTLSLGGAADHYDGDQLEKIITGVRAACAALSERLGAPALR
ncbi:IclR family transcriptional regulator [Janibacter alittae]|uniref:IclR family transcriptional regulator n=1 Tax=Janibacter alittae TaxID=3115209 RepID=A0ABZ2MHF2_9MICO